MATRDATKTVQEAWTEADVARFLGVAADEVAELVESRRLPPRGVDGWDPSRVIRLSRIPLRVSPAHTGAPGGDRGGPVRHIAGPLRSWSNVAVLDLGDSSEQDPARIPRPSGELTMGWALAGLGIAVLCQESGSPPVIGVNASGAWEVGCSALQLAHGIRERAARDADSGHWSLTNQEGESLLGALWSRSPRIRSSWAARMRALAAREVEGDMLTRQLVEGLGQPAVVIEPEYSVRAGQTPWNLCPAAVELVKDVFAPTVATVAEMTLDEISHQLMHPEIVGRFVDTGWGAMNPVMTFLAVWGLAGHPCHPVLPETEGSPLRWEAPGILGRGVPPLALPVPVVPFDVGEWVRLVRADVVSRLSVIASEGTVPLSQAMVRAKSPYWPPGYELVVFPVKRAGKGALSGRTSGAGSQMRVDRPDVVGELATVRTIARKMEMLDRARADAIRRARHSGIGVSEIARAAGVTRPTVYSVLAQAGE